MMDQRRCGPEGYGTAHFISSSRGWRELDGHAPADVTPRHGTGLMLPVTVMEPVDGNVKGTSMHRWGSDAWQMIPLSGLFLGDAHMVATSAVPAATHAGIAHPMFIPHVDDLKYEPFHVCDSPFGPRGRGAMQIAGHATGAHAAHEVTQP
jgi:hypothetical protein